MKGEKKRCSEEVYRSGSYHRQTCARNAVVFPDGEGKKGFCRQHSPAETQKRADLSDAKYRREMARLKLRTLGARAIKAISKMPKEVTKLVGLEELQAEILEAEREAEG